MRPPERVTVPTCIGCGAMSQVGTCETSCSEQKLELVRAAALDELVAVRSDAQEHADAFRPIAEAIARGPLPAEDWDAAYRQLLRSSHR